MGQPQDEQPLSAAPDQMFVLLAPTCLKRRRACEPRTAAPDLFLGRGTDGTLLLDPVWDLLNLFAVRPRSPANEGSDLSVSDFTQRNKLPASTFVIFFFSPFIFRLKAAGKLPASDNAGFGVFVSSGEYSALFCLLRAARSVS